MLRFFNGHTKVALLDCLYILTVMFRIPEEFVSIPRSGLRFSGQKIPDGNFQPEKTLRYCRPSWGKERDLASEATYDA